MHQLRLFAVIFLVVIGGCDQATMMKTMTPAEDEQAARGYIDLLRTNQFARIEEDLNPDIKTPNVHDTLIKMAALIPSQDPQSVKVVGSNISQSPELYQSNITFEYQFPNKWLLANVARQKKDGVTTIIGLNVTPISDSLENLNKFTLSGKSPLHYAVLFAVVLVPLFTLFVLVLCIRTRMKRRKWLWIILIILGFGKFTINWTTGQWSITPLAIQLFGASTYSPPYGAWVLSASLPLGAILFLLVRKMLSEAASKRSLG